MKSSSQIRAEFINFFEKKGHKFVPSSPVIPIGDKTLLFTNAGMNQFKEIFLGKQTPEFGRVANSQKCIRAGGKHNDLEEVGKDGYHNTFFEMLGNWSFGDYFKKEAILYAWQLLTEIWKFPKEKLYATCHTSDKESFKIWQELTDIKNTHIEFFPDEYNFWEMGDVGPCGVCSELHYDKGAASCDKSEVAGHKCKVNGDCGRFIEIWNLVFIEFQRQTSGELTPLLNRFVDTGAGLERICQIVQGVNTNYETDLFAPIIKKIEELSGIAYSEGKSGTPHRVIADHIRALTFSISDGGYPSNEGRGYIIRRILRRASRFARELGQKEPFIYKLVDTVVSLMSEHYQTLSTNSKFVKKIILNEEQRFNITLQRGLVKFEQIVKNTSKTLQGKDAFLLYDTFGFPIDMTNQMAQERGLVCDIAAFEREMAKQRAAARGSAKFYLSDRDFDWVVLADCAKTEFVGYDTLKTTSAVCKFYRKKGEVVFVLDKTPFYAESGGQVADRGVVFFEKAKIRVEDVQKDGQTILHFGKTKDEIDFTKKCVCLVDEDFRESVKKHHTATHLLHKTLKNILGDFVQQKGSLVSNDHFRFDFDCPFAPSALKLREIENIMNRQIRKAQPVKTKNMSLDEAKKDGAMALFGEKYSSQVRVVYVGDYSKELCGGTHVANSGEIGSFKLVRQSSIAAGIRRIEAVCGGYADAQWQDLEDNLMSISQALKAPTSKLTTKINLMLKQNKHLSEIVKKQNNKLLQTDIKKSVMESQKVCGVKVAKVILKNVKNIRQAGDVMKNYLDSGVGIIFCPWQDKVSILVSVSKDLQGRFDATKIVNEIASVVGGRGGGNMTLAVAGGKDVSKIDKAFSSVETAVKKCERG